jgi:hypothetical protein
MFVTGGDENSSEQRTTRQVDTLREVSLEAEARAAGRPLVPYPALPRHVEPAEREVGPVVPNDVPARRRRALRALGAFQRDRRHVPITGCLPRCSLSRR